MEAEIIIKLLRNRDQKGLSLLYDHYAPALLGIIFRIVGSDKIAEEVLQQTFLKIWNKIDTYQEEKATLFTWMSQIARHSSIDARRLKQFEIEKKTESFDVSIHNRGVIKPTGVDIDVASLLGQLDEKYKVIIEQIYLQGHSHTEASEKLDLPLGTVKTRLRKALNLLRQILKNEEGLFRQLILLIPVYLSIWS